MPPKCKDCGGEHWMIEGCRVLSGGEADRVRRAAVGAPAVAAAELREIARKADLVPEEDLAAFDRAQGFRDADTELSQGVGPVQGQPTDLDAYQGGLAGGFGLAAIRTEGAVNDDPTRGGQSAPLVVTENGTYQGGLLVSDPVPSLGQGVIEKYDRQKTYSLQAQRIRKARQSFGLSQTKFGKLFGVGGASIYNWETDKLPQPRWFMVTINFIEREPLAVRRALHLVPPKKRVLIPGKLLEGK